MPSDLARGPGASALAYDPSLDPCDDEMPKRERWLGELDAGIAPFVNVLDAHGVETFESCEGGEGHAAAEPMVRFYGGAGAGPAAVAVAVEHGLPVCELRRYWSVNEHREMVGPRWEIVFSRTAQDGDVDAEWLVDEMAMVARAYDQRVQSSGEADHAE